MSTQQKLGTGDVFPRIQLNSAGGNPFTLPDDIDSEYAIVLFYRGHW